MRLKELGYRWDGYFSFNSRTPCGVRLNQYAILFDLDTFQFTHPVRGATGSNVLLAIFLYSFNSRTPCGVRPFLQTKSMKQVRVSIHAPRAGCDCSGERNPQPLQSFNSRTPCGVRLMLSLRFGVKLMFQFTHPVRGATEIERILSEYDSVSIHAPRAGCDFYSVR